MADEARVLVVDDDADMVRLLKYRFSKEGYQVVTARNGQEGLQQALESRPHVVVTDLMMAGMDGTALCRELKANPDLRPIYVIVLTAKEGTASQISNLELGADDYIVKPVAFHELRAHIDVGLRWVLSQTQLQRMATSDSLTGLPNRLVLDGVLAREVATALQQGKPLSVIWLDLDHFKRINDTYGHAVGDRALQQLADIMRAQVRTTDVPARYGGEEFVIALPGVDLTTATGIARRLRQVIAAGLWPAVIGSLADTTVTPRLDGTRELTASLGVVALDQLTEPTPEVLLRTADAAAYDAKEAGRNRVRVYLSNEQDEHEPDGLADDPASVRDVEVTRLYAAIAHLGPFVSFCDPGLLTQVKTGLDAQAAGWVRWSDENAPSPCAPPPSACERSECTSADRCENRGLLPQGGCVGVSPETAGRLVRHLPWADVSKAVNPGSHRLPAVSLSGLEMTDRDPPLAMATAVAAFGSEACVRGGVWAGWDREIRLTTRHKFILGYLARVLGLELELEAVRSLRGAPSQAR